MKKRIISAALAALMAVSAFSTTAFAAIEADNEIEAESVTILPELKVTVPTSMGFIVNPYKLKVNKATGKEDSTATEQGEIIPVYAGTDTSWKVENSSSVKVKASIYAVYQNGNKNGLSFTQADSATADANQKKVINFQIMGKVGSEGAGTQIKATETAPTSWDTSAAGSEVKAFEIPAISGTTAGVLNLSLANGATKDGKDAWSEDDAITITYGFKFDFIANTVSNNP